MSLTLQRRLAADRLTEALAQLRKALTNVHADLVTAKKALDGLGEASEPHAVMGAVAAAQRLFDSGVASNVAATDVANVLEVLAVLKAAAQEVAIA